jgi:hypothetical protein
MKTNLLAIAGLAFLLAFSAGLPGESSAQGRGPKRFSYEAIAIKQNQPRVIFRGHITAKQFQKWFKSNFAVIGARVEIPKDAMLWGTLVLTNGQEILVLPFYQWNNQTRSVYCCQGFEFGKAPMFRTLEKSEESFLRSMKRQLENLD